MSFRSKLKSAWEQKKAEREKEKRLEQEIYERKKYAREMKSSAERSTKRREKAEEKAEFRATGGYAGALKRGAKQTGKGFAKMGAIAGEKVRSEARKGLKSTSKRMKTGMRGYARDPFGAGQIRRGFDMFGAPKSRKKARSRSRAIAPHITINVGGYAQRKKKKSKKKRSSDPFNIFGNIKL